MKKFSLPLLLLLLALVFSCASTEANEASGSVTGGSRQDIIIPQNVILDQDLSIHFLELGNRFTGDCIYINYGEIDILIDAGSRQSSAATIIAYIDNHIQDNKLEYVIATHAHQDHIAGFYGSAGSKGLFDTYDIGIIIDFPKTNSTTVTYNNYKAARDGAVEKGAVHYTALQCFNNEDGGRRIYDLGGDVRLEILYNPFYETETRSENDYSVCLRIIQGDRQYLFTGDLEERGENALVDFYEEKFGGLGRCVLYKGGHHGSSTSSGTKLMAAITPEYVCVCTCAGSSEYRASPANVFPSQGFVDRVAPYTDKVYITTLMNDYSANDYTSMNGNIIFRVSGEEISIEGSNNNMKLKDTDWFKNNRQMPPAWIKKE